MKEIGKPEIVQKRAEGIDKARERLVQLKELGGELRSLEEDAFVRRAEKLPTDAEISRKIDEITKFVEPQLPFLRDSLKNPLLLKSALGACYELITAVPLILRIAERVADSSEELKKHLENFSELTYPILNLMSESYIAIVGESDEKRDLPRSALKIQHAIDGAAPSLKLFFGEANPPQGREVQMRLHILGDLLSVCSKGKADWAISALGTIIADVISGKDYMPHYSSEAVMENIVRKRDRTEVPEGTITRFDLESKLILLEPEQIR
ncbi:hypothetical protein HYW59_00120 [Candidatus Kaiserbacteria bacterium]|nr:hypothetical protein [Candidatus Kaiserbacteria bacterium]